MTNFASSDRMDDRSLDQGGDNRSNAGRSSDGLDDSKGTGRGKSKASRAEANWDNLAGDSRFGKIREFMDQAEEQE